MEDGKWEMEKTRGGELFGFQGELSGFQDFKPFEFVSDFEFRVSSFAFRVSRFAFRVSYFEFRVSCFVFRVSAFGLWNSSA